MVQRLERLILFPGHLLGAPSAPPRDVSGLERLTIESSEGEVEAWFLPAYGVESGDRRPAVVFAHGNGELIDEWAAPLEPYRKMGIGVLLPEYRGYGRSRGQPSEEAINEDFLRFYDGLTGRADVDPSKILLHGRSLGGGAACALARERPAAGLILESTFTSVVDIARGWHVPSFLLTNRFDNESVVRAFPHPVLILHGRRDRVVPYAHAEALERASPRAKLVTYECDHNDMRRTADGFWSEIASYLRTVGITLRATSF